uniref:Uncharacterized protein n=1 Tax=Timema bartmani TaxID=61472 RepID=A0A7R9HVX5_9NEOP|nr:unnamed protein product [Timema bartmani]
MTLFNPLIWSGKSFLPSGKRTSQTPRERWERAWRLVKIVHEAVAWLIKHFLIPVTIQLWDPETGLPTRKAHEMFIAKLAQLAYEGSTKMPITLEYKHICEIVHNNSDYHFLKEIVPKKITYRRFKEIMEKEQLIANESDTSEDVTDNNSNDEEEEIKIVPQARNKTYGAKKK